MNFSQNFVGVRFLYPVYYIPEVELNPSKWTSTQTIQTGWFWFSQEKKYADRCFSFSEKIHWTNGENVVLSFIDRTVDFRRRTTWKSTKRFFFFCENQFSSQSSIKNEISHLARIESLKKSNAFLIVRGQTLPQLMSNNNRHQPSRNRNELCKKINSKLKLEKLIQFQWKMM